MGTLFTKVPHKVLCLILLTILTITELKNNLQFSICVHPFYIDNSRYPPPLPGLSVFINNVRFRDLVDNLPAYPCLPVDCHRALLLPRNKQTISFNDMHYVHYTGH